MITIKPDTLRGQTILIVGMCLFLFHIASLVLYIIFSASSVTLEREEQIADRIIAVTRLIDHAHQADRAHLASEMSGSKFQVSIDKKALTSTRDDNSAATITGLINPTLKSLHDYIAANYDARGEERELDIQHLEGLFRIHETLLVSIDLPDGDWLNFQISGSAWDHIFSLNAIPSLTLMAFGTILLAVWIVNKPLKSLSRFAKASEDMGMNIQSAQPINEEGPKEIRDVARSFNQMQLRVRRLLEARNYLLGALSHDFRTPLTRLRLRTEYILDEEQQVKAIRDLAEMEAMIKFTLAFARDEAAGETREQVDLKILIQDIISDLDILADSISISSPESVHISCCPIAIRRALTNIIKNGVFYGDQVYVELFWEAGQVIINVDDVGPGIDLQQRDRVFTPFYRLEPSRNRETGGVGLGLSIAQTVIHAHGGVIKLLDSPMGGLRVHINLPQGQNHSSPQSSAREAII